jgi:hypothetical protein
MNPARPDHESAILAAVLLAQRAQQGETSGSDLDEATDRLAELAGQPDGEEEGQADAGG